MLAAVSVAGPAAARPLDQVTAANSLRVAVYRDFPPFSSGDQNSLNGLDVDLAKAIADRLSVKVEYMILTAGEKVDDDLRNAVWKGHYLGGGVADLMLHVPADPLLELRNDNVHIFSPYYREHVAVCFDPAQTGGTDLVSAFGEHKVGVEGDSIADLYLTGAYGGAVRKSVVHFKTLDEAAAAFKAGKLAGLMAPLSQIEGALGADKGRCRVANMPLPGLMHRAWPIGMAVKVNSRDLGNAVEAAMDAMLADGTVAKLFAKHGLSYSPPNKE
jgi:ABC-type amino acid transport substrate-binding protein